MLLLNKTLLRFCCFSLSLALAIGAPQQGGDNPGFLNGFSQSFIQSIGKGASEFPDVWKPYFPQRIPLPVMENSPLLHSLIHDGKLELSLADALTLALENNLDMDIERYVIPFAATDILRTKSGQANRGFTGALQPGELNSGAIGAGVTNGGGAGGTGNAGGITGGGGAVSIGSAGAFDPSVSYSWSYDHVVSPLNSIVVSGIPTTTSAATANTFSYAQMFTEGTSYSVSLSTLRQSTTQENTLFNPDVASRLSVGINQPLLAGFGFLPNKRFIMVARNNQGTAQEVFRQQVIASIVQVENAYYDLAEFQDNVNVTQKSLDASKELLAETIKEKEIGVLSNLDVVTVQSQVASSQRDLIVAQTNLQVQQTTLKQLISKKGNPELDAATIVLTDLMPEPSENDVPDAETAFRTAMTNRPELREAVNNLANQDVGIKYAASNVKPSLAVFGLYAGSGLQGNTLEENTIKPGGAVGSLTETFDASYPEMATGLSFSATIRNRSAQADNIRSQLERNQQELTLQSTKNQVQLQVQQGRIALIQGRQQVAAAREATRLAQVTLDAERVRLRNGLSTAYNVVLMERDLVTAQYAQVQAEDAYAKALVAMNQAMGDTLEQNRIQLNEAVTGTVTQRPSVPYHLPARTPGSNQ
jgi:outer membrane protein TolC